MSASEAEVSDGDLELEALDDYDPDLDAGDSDADDDPPGDKSEAGDGADPDDDDDESEAGPAEADTADGEAEEAGLWLPADSGAGDGADALSRSATAPRRVLVVAPEDRRTASWVSPYEFARVIAIRAQQISDGQAHFLPDGSRSFDNARDIALAEFRARRTPLVLRRKVGRTIAGEAIIEIWRVRELSGPLNAPGAYAGLADPAGAR